MESPSIRNRPCSQSLLFLKSSSSDSGGGGVLGGNNSRCMWYMVRVQQQSLLVVVQWAMPMLLFMFFGCWDRKKAASERKREKERREKRVWAFELFHFLVCVFVCCGGKRTITTFLSWYKPPTLWTELCVYFFRAGLFYSPLVSINLINHDGMISTHKYITMSFVSGNIDKIPLLYRVLRGG